MQTHWLSRQVVSNVNHILSIDILGVSFCKGVKIFWRYLGKCAHSQVSKEAKLNCFFYNNFTSAMWIPCNIQKFFRVGPRKMSFEYTENILECRCFLGDGFLENSPSLYDKQTYSWIRKWKVFSVSPSRSYIREWREQNGSNSDKKRDWIRDQIRIEWVLGSLGFGWRFIVNYCNFLWL
jgi:hypothetical protein